MDLSFSAAEWDLLLTHIGYGNPAGPLWFLGMEEKLDGERDANLRWRLDHFAHPVDTLTNHLNAPWIGPDLPRTPTWPTMAKIARLLVERAPDWRDGAAAKRYVRERLGAGDGDTFLFELVPLPNRSEKTWAYQDRFPEGRPGFQRTHLDDRIRSLRQFALDHNPRVVICYGKRLWPDYERVFPLDGRRQLPLGATEVILGRWANSQILLTPFFVPYAFPVSAIAELPGILGHL
jgi:hypothetical protein